MVTTLSDPLTPDEEKYVEPLRELFLETLTGRDQAMRGRYIVGVFQLRFGFQNFSHNRFRRLVYHLRHREGMHQILGTVHGYYYETNPERLRHYQRTLEARAEGFLRSASTFFNLA